MPENNEIETLRQEIAQLKQQLSVKEEQLRALSNAQKNSPFTCNSSFTTEEITRYSRQMLVPAINAHGQYLLKNGNVLIVGVGGLGCPAALYLASAGVGKLTLVDYDEVELSNLHRQVLHGINSIGKPKVNSAQDFILGTNPNVCVTPLKLQANSTNIEEILKNDTFHCILDCSDNVPTRYLLNDASKLYNTPLISGSALKTDGQLTVYNYKNGPCFRCLFPKPPPATAVESCGDSGVLGPVPGVIGVLQALEAIKIITRVGDVLNGRFLMFDGMEMKFREVKLRQKSMKCDICGEKPTVKELVDYEVFCGAKANDKVININVVDKTDEININEINKISEKDIILDVRPDVEYMMCSLPSTVNFPFVKIINENFEELRTILEEKVAKGAKNVYLLCRRGNDSQRALLILKSLEKLKDLNLNFFNIKGGLYAYSKHIDADFPMY